MADPALSAETPALEKPGSPPPARPARLEVYEALLRGRFGLAYLALAVVVGVAVGLFVVLLGRDGAGGEAWSAWKPTEHGQAGAAQIARYLQVRYRLPSGSPIVGIIVRSPAIENQDQTVQVRYVAVRSGFPDEPVKDIEVYRTDGTLFYYLCGFGPQCAIEEGTPSTARGLLLRREGLELALFTFKYVDGIDAVVTFIPPKPGENPQALMYFRKADFEAELSRPLPSTLPQRAAYFPGRLSPLEQETVARLTSRRLYQFQYQQIPDGTAALVIAPIQA